jgi:hypothetical protein
LLRAAVVVLTLTAVAVAAVLAVFFTQLHSL